jgi:hypothetical protein
MVMNFDGKKMENAMTSTRQSEGRQPGRSPVRLHIERLVLHGFPAAGRRRIAEQVRSELERLMGEGGPMQSLMKPMAVDRARGESFRIGADANPHAAGRQIAQAVYRSLQGSNAASSRAPGIGSRGLAGGHGR